MTSYDFAWAEELHARRANGTSGRTCPPRGGARHRRAPTKGDGTMRVKDLQTSDVYSCSPDTNLAAAAQIMWDHDCGVVPVVDEQRGLLGMITDRDICIATTTRSAAPADIQVRHVMTTGTVYSCRPDDDVRTVLATMGTHRVRRLPVVDRQNHLVGIVSINDLARRTDYRSGSDLPGKEFIETMQAICTHTPAHAHVYRRAYWAGPVSNDDPAKTRRPSASVTVRAL